MASKTWTAGTVIDSSWLQDVNEHVYAGKSFDTISTINVKDPTYGAKGDGVTNDTAAIQAALNSGYKHIYIPAGTYIVTALTAVALKTVYGAGIGKTILKIVAGGTTDIITSSVNDFTLSNMTLDYTGGAGTGRCGLFSGGANLQLSNIRAINATGIGLYLYNSPGFRLDNIIVDGAGNWGLLIDGTLTTYGVGSRIHTTNGADRGLMVRDASYCSFHQVSGYNNKATAVWFNNCVSCHLIGGEDYLDLFGDSFVIEGVSIGCSMSDVKARTSGGHTASVSSTGAGAPIDCHFRGVYSEGAGEAIAAITDQGTGNRPTNCTITGVSGKNCGRVTPSEGFGIANAQGCTISGYITSTTGTMTYAVNESGATPNNNVFEVFQWVPGIIKPAVNLTLGSAAVGATTATAASATFTSGDVGKWFTVGAARALVTQFNSNTSINIYITVAFAGTAIASGTWGWENYFAITSSTSVIRTPGLLNKITHVGDTDYFYNPATDGDLLYDTAALTAARTVYLSKGWPGLRTRVSRPSTGAFNLTVKSGPVNLKALAAATWTDISYDASNANLSAYGTL